MGAPEISPSFTTASLSSHTNKKRLKEQEPYEYEESEGSLRNKSTWDGFDDDCEIVGLGGVSPLTLQQQLEIEKKVYPGAKTWAPREELLFERLFMRQELAMLPAHWNVDFRDVPIGDATFAVEGESEPIIYAYAKEFPGMIRLKRLQIDKMLTIYSHHRTDKAH